MGEKFKFLRYFWYVDYSKGLHKKGITPNWRILDDRQSLLVERGFFVWLQNGKHKRRSRVRVSAQYIVDFMVMRLIQLPEGQWRWVRRGAQGERSKRPSDDRFSDNSDFNLGGQFRPLSEDWDNDGYGGAWLCK